MLVDLGVVRATSDRPGWGSRSSGCLGRLGLGGRAVCGVWQGQSPEFWVGG